MQTNDPNRLKARIAILMAQWAPPHAQLLLKEGWRLSDGSGLTWVMDLKPHLRLDDFKAKNLHDQQRRLADLVQSASNYSDVDMADRYQEQLDNLPSFEELGA